MPKLIAAGALIAVGLVIVASQVFRNDPNTLVFFGGIGLVIFATLYGDDAVDGMYEEEDQS